MCAVIVKSPTEMKTFLFVQKSDQPRTLLWPVVAALILLGAVAAPLVSAQQRMSRKYPTGKNVRLQLKNISGEIIVESWDRDEIKVSATMESRRPGFTAANRRWFDHRRHG
jgi:hypothetical protein